MSRERILDMIRRVERIADMFPDVRSESEANALTGQLSGTLSAIVREFEMRGISVENSLLTEWGYRLQRSGDPYDAQHAAHIAAGFLRGLADEL